MASHDYRPDIDGLRAFAIIPVLFFHAGVPGLDGGFVGVDVFFVISGYLISRLIYRELDEQRFSIVSFYERRARRIAPAFLAVSLLTFVAAAVFLFPTRLVEFCKSLLWSALAVGNIYFWQESAYFGPEANTQPLLHYWSLGVEEQFYFLFPALAMLIWRSSKPRLGLTLALILAISLVASELMIWRSPEAAFYLLPFRAWELLVGSMLAMRTVPSPPTRTIATGAVTVGIGLILTSVFLLSEQTTFPGLSALLPVVGSSLAIWGGEHRNIAAAALGFAPLVYIGRISYSLYLVHWPVLFFATRLISDTGAATRTTIVIAVSLVLADLSYRFIETPTRRRSPCWTSARIFWLTATGVLVGVGLSLGTILAGGFSGRLPADAQALLAYRYDRAAGYREGTCFLQRDQPASALAPECLPTNGPIALIWGDSHAAHLLPGLQPALEAKGYAVAQITASGCQPVRGFETPRRPNCGSVNDFALDWIRRTKPSLVIMSAIWTLDGHMDSFRSQIDELAELGIQIIILGPSPIFPEAIPVLLAERLTRGDQTTSWDNLPPDAYAYDVELGEAFKTWPTRYISLLEITCPQQSCPLILDRMPIYWDGEHLTTAGAQALVAGLVDRIPASQ